MSEPRKLYREPDEAWLGGVAAGLARYAGMDVTAMRVVFALVIVFTGLFPGGVAYLVMWLVIPERPRAPPPPTPAPPP